MSKSVLGIDIAKHKFDVALLVEGKIKHKACQNNPQGFDALRIWLEKQKSPALHACMEATSTYGEELATYLHDLGHKVSIVNPARVKGFAHSELIRTKNDSVDSGLIARFCLAMDPEPWQPPSPEERRLQAQLRRIEALTNMRIQEENRLEVSHCSVKDSIKEHIAYLEKEIESVKKEVKEQINSNPDLKGKKDLLISITGLGDVTSANVIAELPDIKRFSHSREVVAFLGLAPRQNESGTFKGKARLCKVGNSRLRKALYMPALVAMRHNPVIKEFAARLRERGKHGKVIVCAVMRKLVHIIYGVLKSGKPFNPDFKPNLA